MGIVVGIFEGVVVGSLGGSVLGGRLDGVLGIRVDRGDGFDVVGSTLGNSRATTGVLGS